MGLWWRRLSEFFGVLGEAETMGLLLKEKEVEIEKERLKEF